MQILNRIYSDFLLPSRMNEYEKLIVSVKDAGYKHITIPKFYNLLKSSSIVASDKLFIHRHDIDTDINTARMFFEVEKKHQVVSSFYFRLCTFDVKLIKEIDDAGFEVGYHFEELSDFCKQNGIKKSEELPSHFEVIQDKFRANCRFFEEKSKVKIKSVAAHGDFVNRFLKISNNAFLSPELLNELGIEFECYNELLIKNYNYIGSDMNYPAFYRPSSPFDAIEKNIPIVYFLSHPRHWRSNIVENLTDNLNRFIQGLSYKCKK